MKAMLVDDSRTMRRIMRRTLNKLNIFEITEAAEGMEAINYLKNEEVDIILMDWNMPKMDGLACLKNIRANSSLKDIKVIMVTSESERYRVMEAVKEGANDYITKPYTPEILKEKLAAAGLIE